MLCLTRKVGERIRIGKDIWVCVVEKRDGRLVIGIQAPKDVPVVREELIKREEKPEAA